MPGEAVRNMRRLTLVAIVLAAAAGALVLGAVSGAFAVSSPQGVDATTRFEFLARAASPVPAVLLLAAVLLVSLPDGGDRSPAGRAAVGAAAFLGVVVVLLAVNGVLLDITSGSASVLTRVSRIVFLRLAPIVLAGTAVWASLTETRKVVSEQAPPEIPRGEEG